MSRRAGGGRATIFALGLVLGAASPWVAERWGPMRAGAAPPARASAPLPVESSRRNAIVVAARKASPAVVSVSVVQTRIVRQVPFGGLPRDEFWDQFFPPQTYQERLPGMGSGVIVDASGLVLTNEHVVRDADDIRVTLADGRHFPARRLGQSPVYDLAVLKIEGSDLPVAELGRADDLVVGEWAVAIGNPFGFLLEDSQPTVTAGVISATRRDIKSEVSERGIYKGMIQTDAAINPGNSGGPLVNADGQVIGINTFIFTRGGGSLGMGFAIPIEVAKKVLEEVRVHGRVRQAYLGIDVQVLTPVLAQRLGYDEAGGLVISRVEPDGPAARAGVRAGDRIVEVNGKTVRDVNDAQASIYGTGVGDVIAFTLDRRGQRLTVRLTLVEAPRRGER
jgi:serine protease Do